MSAIQSDVIVLDSKQRSSGTVQQAVYNLFNMNGLKGTYNVIDFQSVNNTYNVIAGQNDTVYWTEPGALNITIPPGNYTVATLNTAINTLMDAASASTFTPVVNADNGLVTWTIAAGTFAFAWGTNAALNNLANLLMGFAEVDGVAAAGQTSTQVPNLQLHTHLLLNILEDGRKDVTISTGAENSFMVPLPAFGAQIDFQEASSYDLLTSFGPTNITTINVHMFTEDGVAAVLPNEYVMVLQKLFE